MIERRAVGQIAYKGLVARALDEVGDPVHRPAERPFLPALGLRRTIEHLGQPVRARQPAKRCRTFGAQGALVDRAARVAFNVDDVSILGINQLGAADRAIGADAGADRVRLFEPGPELPRRRALRRFAGRVAAGKLPRQGPVTDKPRDPVGNGVPQLHGSILSVNMSSAVRSMCATCATRRLGSV